MAAMHRAEPVSAGRAGSLRLRCRWSVADMLAANSSAANSPAALRQLAHRAAGQEPRDGVSTSWVGLSGFSASAFVNDAMAGVEVSRRLVAKR